MQPIARLQRLSNGFHRRGLRPISRALDLLSRLFFAAAVPGRATIGKDVFFHHGGLGVVINGLSVIEEGCEVGVHVVLGGRAPVRGAPHLGRNVIVHAGARLIGPITIGEGCVVAANAVVIEDVPPFCLVAGVPAMIKREGIDNTAYRHDAPVIERADVLT